MYSCLLLFTVWGLHWYSKWVKFQCPPIVPVLIFMILVNKFCFSFPFVIHKWASFHLVSPILTIPQIHLSELMIRFTLPSTMVSDLFETNFLIVWEPYSIHMSKAFVPGIFLKTVMLPVKAHWRASQSFGWELQIIASLSSGLDSKSMGCLGEVWFLSVPLTGAAAGCSVEPKIGDDKQFPSVSGNLGRGFFFCHLKQK